MRKSTKAVSIAAAAVLFIGMGTAAFAYWTATGTGTGGAITSSNDTSHMTVEQTSVINNLAPGVSAQALTGTIVNDGSGPGYVNAITATIASVTKAVGAIGACTVADYALADEVMDVQTDIAAGDTYNWSGATIVFVNSADNQDGCRGATVNVTYALS